MIWPLCDVALNESRCVFVPVEQVLSFGTNGEVCNTDFCSMSEVLGVKCWADAYDGQINPVYAKGAFFSYLSRLQLLQRPCLAKRCHQRRLFCHSLQYVSYVHMKMKIFRYSALVTFCIITLIFLPLFRSRRIMDAMSCDATRWNSGDGDESTP